MAQPEPNRWGRAALGGLLVALGGALLGATREGPAAAAKAAPKGRDRQTLKPERQGSTRAAGKPGASPRPRIGRAHVRTAPKPETAPARTRHWPPPPPKPIEPAGDVHAAEAQDREDRPPVDQTSRRLGFEVGDARAGAIARVMVVSVSLIAASIAGLFWFVGRSHRDDAVSPPLTPQQLAVIVPPGPRLQDHPLHDIAAERQREADLLRFYAWADPGHRAARVPLARAQALVIGRPLDPLPTPDPVSAPPPAPSSAP